MTPAVAIRSAECLQPHALVKAVPESDLPQAGKLLLILGLHAALGLAMHRLPQLATLHTMATLLAVLAISLSTKSPAVVLMCAAYVCGSEVLWRMSRSFTFHETAKYMLALLSMIGMVRLGRVRLPGPAVLYLALMIPAALFTFYYFPLNVSRKTVMFHLSGPIAVTFSILFCSNLRVVIPELWRIVVAFVTPLCGVAAVTVVSSYLNEVRFTTESNVQTSGGFGPNQVASSLALGALMLALALLMARMPPKLRAAFALLAALMVVQSAMTFSRGGVTASALALTCALPFALSGHRYRWQVLLGLAGLALLLMLVFPAVNAYTGGKLAERFSEKEMSGREKLAIVDWMLFEEHPLFGVGVGISSYFHPGNATAHTEFTRALAEHGSLGLLAYVSLAWLLLRRSASILLDPFSRPLRGFLVGAMVWAMLYLAVNAMRTSAPAFALSLSFLTILPAAVRAGQRFVR